ncbi:hypothetical protein GGR51DRAFT_524386 [Nemania sp. FL0031]|nr:hypothetical protein GGR51DRAFT_524386 [Nemania sp. FL0031]
MRKTAASKSRWIEELDAVKLSSNLCSARKNTDQHGTEQPQATASCRLSFLFLLLLLFYYVYSFPTPVIELPHFPRIFAVMAVAIWLSAGLGGRRSG